MLRKRKNRRYNEQEEGDGVRKFNILDQIKSKRFDSIKGKHLQELTGDTLTLKLIQRNGFDKPIIIQKPDGLSLRVPQKSFQVKDVRNYVGHERIIDVMDVKTQKNIEMSMKDWCKYYESKNRDKLLNVISLEFSHTKLDDLVEAPLIVRLLDWVDLVWPKFLKQSQTESTNSIDKMKYPKVQKYCLMSVKGSYTDFHIDFGGTSVWYHILRGKKIFWMVPPTELNLQTFEEWTLSGMQQDVFFGDTVEECFRVELCAGNTFFIPSGWIHAVYTLEDSLVFGGNFLHSFGIENQLKVSKIEDATRVPIKFRYPFYTEILWYVVQHYVHCLTGKDHLQRPDPSKLSIEDSSVTANSSPEKTLASKKNKSIESEDETTESEQDERDKKNTKRKPATGKRARPSNRRTTRSKRSRKQTSSNKKEEEDEDEEDDSTEIDSSNEDSKPAEKVTTCRMTKNSLLRLQYEVDERQNNNQQQSTQSKDQNKSNKSNQPSSPSKQASSSSAAVKTTPTQSTSISNQQANKQSPTSVKNTGTTVNLAEIILNQETSKLNGWGSSGATTGNQTTWSSNAEESEPKGPPRIYVTKYELNGLKCLVKHLGKLSGAKKNLPALIRNSRALLDDCRKMIAEHENDDPELSVTGKPITIELLNAKKSDINDLIGQFFKPKLEICANNESTSTTSLNKNESLVQQQKFKSNLSLDSSLNDKIKSSNTSLHGGISPQIDAPKSPDKKETKCLNPNKKSSTPNSVTTPNSGTPPRPKSPPTRPISNNQYTSRTKSSGTTSNNNLLLPGSFADLIAATSTEKKVFEVSGADIASSLFGSSSSVSPQKHSSSAKNKSEEGDKLDSSAHKSSPKVADLLDKPDALTIPTKGGTGASTSSVNADATGATKDQSTVVPSTSGTNKSPEPPKSSPQKRFLNPAFKAQNKEKLIFASAPYVSPVHDQARSNNLYPWQAQPMHHMQTPSRIPGAPGQASMSHEANSGTASHGISGPPSIQSFHHHQVAPTTYKPDTPKLPLNQAEISPKNTSTNNDTSSLLHKVATGDAKHDAKRDDQKVVQNQEKQPDSRDVAKKGSQQTESESTQRHQIAVKPAANVSPQPAISPNTSTEKPKQALEQCPKVATPTQPPAHASICQTKVDSPNKTKSSESGEISGEPKAKKPAKPRGPPKKSKEARQVLTQSETPAVPVSVIKIAPSTSGTSFQPFPIQHHQLPQMFQAAPQPASTPTKATKAKRPKKQKANEAPSTVNNNTATLATLTQQHAALIANQTMFSQAAAGQQQLYGFVAPPVSSGATTSVSSPTGLATVKVSQPSYLLSRPFLFNTMPTLSTAQLQSGLISRPPLRMISTSIPSTMGLPAMHQGARIVWATQPQRLAPTVTTTNTKPAHAPKPNQQTNTAKATNAKTASASTSSSTTSTPMPLPSASTSQISNNAAAAAAMNSRTASSTQPDNAALLSLATTALSTAPMISNPSLSGFGNRPTAPQAIMVSSANTHPALFAANQHLFSPMMQRLPMAPIVTTTRPGAPRPTGQLVFARLPNQNLFNNQPRYLITPPGFIQQRMQAPNLIPGHSGQTLAFAPYKPQTSQPKTVKTKKVRTS